jgi:DNA-binding response OmpR family regulator
MPPSAERVPTVLVVDDERPILDLIHGILEDEGFSVITAENGHAALSIATKALPDVVVSDIMMPHMDGFTLWAELRRCSKTAHIPVLLISAGRQHSNGDPCTWFIAKPFDIEILIERIWQMLDKSKFYSH